MQLLFDQRFRCKTFVHKYYIILISNDFSDRFCEFRSDHVLTVSLREKNPNTQNLDISKKKYFGNRLISRAIVPSSTSRVNCSQTSPSFFLSFPLETFYPLTYFQPSVVLQFSQYMSATAWRPVNKTRSSAGPQPMFTLNQAYSHETSSLYLHCVKEISFALATLEGFGD